MKTKRKNKPGAGQPVTIWPPEMVARLRELYPTLSTEAVAAELGVTASAVRNAAIRFKVKKKDRYWDLPEENYVRDNWPVMSAQEIADKLGRSRWAVISKWRELRG